MNAVGFDRRSAPGRIATRSLVAALAIIVGVTLLPVGQVGASGRGHGGDTHFEPGGVSDETPLGTADRVLIFSVPTLTWKDLRTYDAPNLTRLLENSVVADLSVRSVTRRTGAVDGYATLNAGTRTEGTPQGSLAFVAGLNRGSTDTSGDPTDPPAGAFENNPPEDDLPSQPVTVPQEGTATTDAANGSSNGGGPTVPEVVESYDGSPAAEEFARRTGVLPPVGSVFNFGIVSMRQLNSRLLFDSEVGSLGDALAGAGIGRAVIANGDFGQGADEVDYRREASVSLMDSDGLVERGRVSGSLLEDDPFAPFGTRYDNAEVVSAFKNFWYSKTAVTVEASDMVRNEAVVPLVLESQQEAFRRQAIENSDELLGMLLGEVDLSRDAVVVVAPYASGESTDLTVVGVRAPSVKPGLLSSGTTRRSGFVQTVDLAPSILSLFGAEKPSTMEGTVMERGNGGGSLIERRNELADAAAAAVFRDATLGGASVVFVLAQVALWLLAVWTLMRPGRRLRTTVEVATLSVLTYLPVTFFAGAFPFQRWGAAAWWSFVLGVSVVLALVIHFATRRYLVDPLVVTLGFVVSLFSVDILLGGPLQFNTVFGYSPTVAGRFNGLGNPAFSMLTAAGIILACLVAHRMGGRRGLISALGILVWCVILDGAPMFGADVGGALTLVPAVGVTAAMLIGWKIRVRSIVVGGLVTVAVVIGFGLLDLMRPPAEQTHLGRLFSDIGSNGFESFQTVVFRKLNANLSVVTSSIWTLMVPLVFIAVTFVIWWAPWRIRSIAERIPEERAAVGGLTVAMVLGFALNDSGISVPGIMLGVVNASLVNLLLRVDLRLPSRPGEIVPVGPVGPDGGGADDSEVLVGGSPAG